MAKKKKKKKVKGFLDIIKTIRRSWGMNPQTKVQQNEKNNKKKRRAESKQIVKENNNGK